jgi:hypothetical protein
VDLARFDSLDSYFGSASDPGSLHKYTYVRNSPISFLDPDGFDQLLSGLGVLGNQFSGASNYYRELFRQLNGSFTQSQVNAAQLGLSSQALTILSARAFAKVLSKANEVLKGSGYVGAINEFVGESKNRPNLIGASATKLLRKVGYFNLAVGVGLRLEQIARSSVSDETKATAATGILVIYVVGFNTQTAAIPISIKVGATFGGIAGSEVPVVGNAAGAVIGGAAAAFVTSALINFGQDTVAKWFLESEGIL